MRLSSYEIVLPLADPSGGAVPNKALLVNGLYGALDVVGSDVARALAAARFSQVPPNVLGRLSRRGHVTTKDEAAELADVKLLGRIYRMTVGRAKANVVILPTFDCNFRCPYCYESNRLGNGREWLSRTIAPQTIDAVSSAIDDLRARGYAVSECSLFGGEPLLASNRATVQAIARRTHNAGLSIAAVTNGYDLNAFLDLMEECEFSSLQVTVDGVREVHDRRRVHLSDGGTYDRILRNIGLALDRGVKVSVRVNVDKHNLAGMRDLVADFGKRGLVDETCAGRDGFSYYFKATEGDENSDWCVSEREILDELLRMGFSAGEAIEREGQYLMFVRALRRTLRKESLPPIQTAFCGAETGTAVVDPFGRLFTCIDRVTYDDAVVGRLNEEEGCFDWSFTRAKWRTRTSDLLLRCQACPYVFACQGGCASQAKRVHGTYFREACGSMQETFDYVASHVAGDAWAREGTEELSLSWAEPLSLLGDEDRKAIASTTDESRIACILEGVGAPLAML